MSKAVEVVNFTPSYYSVQFHVYRLLIAPSIIDNLIIQVGVEIVAKHALILHLLPRSLYITLSV